MKIKKLVSLSLAVLMAAELPLMSVNAVRPGKDISERAHYISSSGCGAVFGPYWYKEDTFNEIVKREKDPKKQLAILTSAQYDALRKAADQHMPKDKHITSTAHVTRIGDAAVASKKVPDSTARIRRQSEMPGRENKTSYQLAHDLESEYPEAKTATVFCANAQCRLGRPAHSLSQEEKGSKDAIDYIGLITGMTAVLAGKITNEAADAFYGNGREHFKNYNPCNALISFGVSFFADKCSKVIYEFTSAVRDDLQTNPNGLKDTDIITTNVIAHAAPDSEQAGSLDQFKAYLREEFRHLFIICVLYGIKCIVIPRFGTGSFIKLNSTYTPDDAVAVWDSILAEVYEEYGKPYGIDVIIADAAPRAAKVNIADVVESQKQPTKDMLKATIGEQKAPDAIVSPKDTPEWGM